MPDVRCRCCGIGVEGLRERIRRCILCDLCDGLHGDQRQLHVGALVRHGQVDAWHGIAMMMLDDSHHAGMLEIVVVQQPGGADVSARVTGPVPRWRVVIGRALARGELPDVSLVMQSALARWIPGFATPDVMAGIRRDLTDALKMLDANVIDVDVKSTRDVLDPHSIDIVITGHAATLGQLTMPGADAIPDDILSRPRGQA